MALEEIFLYSVLGILVIAVLVLLYKKPTPVPPVSPPAPQPGVFGIKIIPDQTELYYGEENLNIKIELTEGSRPNLPIKIRTFLNGKMIDESPLLYSTWWQCIIRAESLVLGENTISAECLDATNVVATTSITIKTVEYPGLKITYAKLTQVGPKTYKWECEWTPTKPPYWVSVILLGTSITDQAIIANLEKVETNTFTITKEVPFEAQSGYMTLLDQWSSTSIVGIGVEK